METYQLKSYDKNLKHLRFYLFLFLLSFFVLIAGGTIQSSDGSKMYEVTKSIVQRGEFSISPDYHPNLSPGLNGKYYTQSGIGQSVVPIPLYVLGSVVSKLANMDEDYVTEFAVSMLNPIVLTLVCVVFFSLGQKIGYTVKASFVVSLCFVFTTMVFPYVKTFFNHPLTILFLLLTVYYIISIKGEDYLKVRLILSGLYLGLTILVRYQMIIVIPIFLIYLLFVYLKSENVWLSVKRYFKNIPFFIIPICLALFIIGWYNSVRFGNPFWFSTSFHSEIQLHFEKSFQSPFSAFIGFVSLLFSPGRGIVWYNPILLLFPFGFFYLRKNYRLEAFLFFSLISVELIFYSFSRFWHGANAWGPRYILETLPFFVLASYYVCKKVNFKRVAIMLTIVSFLIQFPSVIVSYRAYTFKMQQEYKEQTEEKMLYSIKHSPIIGQWQIVADVLTKSDVDKESIRNLANSKLEGEEEDDPSLTLNTPYFWFYYLYLLGFPPLLIIVPIGFLLCFMAFSLFQITRRLKNLDRTKPGRCNNYLDPSDCHIKSDSYKRYINRIKVHAGHILYYLRSNGRTILPRTIVLELTNRCNLRCSMCWWNFEGHQDAGSKELTLHDVRKLIDDLTSFTPRLVLTGSELLLRKDITEILEYIYEKNLRIDCIMTNGTLMTEEIAKAIVKVRPEIVQFSIDGDENVHDRIREMKGAYQRTVRGIKVLKSAIEYDGINSMDIRLNCVVLPQNVHCLGAVAKLAGELGVQLQFQYLMWLDQNRISAHESFLRNRLGFNDNTICNLYNKLDGLDLKVLDKQLAEIKVFCNETGVPLYFMQFSDQVMIRRWYSDLNYVPRRKCIEPFLVSRIGAEGNVKFCPLIDYSYGNVKEIPFNVLWNNQRALKIRSLLKKVRLFPGCIRCCKL